MTKDFKELARYAARNTAPANFSKADVNEAFRQELKKHMGTIPQFMKNRYDLYEIIIENANDIVPANVLSALGRFAEIVVVGQGQKKMFRTSKANSKLRARKFLTQVGLSGAYETFRLDRDTFEIAVHAIGGATILDFERILDGEEDLFESMEVLTDGLVHGVFMEVQKALRALVSSTKIPEANLYSDSAFNGDELFRLASIAKSYAGGAVIFAPPEFIAAMGPDAIVPVSAFNVGTTQAPVMVGVPGMYSPQDIDSIHKTGYVNIFRGFPIVQMPQSFTDTTNSKVYIDPQLAYVLPAGKEKVVKVVMEGSTQIDDFKNRDRSMEVEVYRKIGAGILTENAICVYKNSGVTGVFDESLGYGL